MKIQNKPVWFIALLLSGFMIGFLIKPVMPQLDQGLLVVNLIIFVVSVLGYAGEGFK